MPRFKALYCKVFPQDEPVGIQIKKACPVELFLVDGLDSTMKTRTKSENSSEVKFKMTQEAKETGGTQRLLINNYVSENCFLKHKKEASDTHATDTTKPFDTQLERTNKKNKGGILRRLGKRLRKLGRNIVGKATKG